MNFEGLEQFRYETTKKVMESLAEVAADPKQTMADRLEAAKIVDRMSDSIIKAYLMTAALNADESKSKGLIKQLEKLTEREP